MDKIAIKSRDRNEKLQSAVTKKIMIVLSAAESLKLCSDEGKPVNTNVKETKSEQQLISPSVRILEGSCYFLSSG